MFCSFFDSLQIYLTCHLNIFGRLNVIRLQDTARAQLRILKGMGDSPKNLEQITTEGGFFQKRKQTLRIY